MKQKRLTKFNSIVVTLSLILWILIFYIIIVALKYNIEGYEKDMDAIRDEQINKDSNFTKDVFYRVDEVTGEIKYSSSTILITIESIKRKAPNLTMWISTITIKSAEQLKASFAGEDFSREIKEKTSSIAQRKEAILAINGAACGFNGSGFVIRDGIVYRESNLDHAPLIIKSNGDFVIYKRGEKTGKEILDMGGRFTFDFGPDLIKNGEIVDWGNSWYVDGKDPRTAIGQKGPLEYVIITVDGRSEESEGMSFKDLAIEFKRLGCQWAYALDGGGSTTLYFNGQVINKPSDWTGERKISDILYFTE